MVAIVNGKLINDTALGLCLLLVTTWALAGTETLSYQHQTIDIKGKQYQVRVPRGYVLEVVTTELDRPRLMTFAPNGDLFVGSKSGKVYRLEPPYTQPQVLITLNDYPHSVALRNNEIFIAQNKGLYRAPYRAGQDKINKKELTRLVSLPGGRGHSSRTVAIGPDMRIYLSLGISGNCSDEYLGDGYSFDDRRGGVLVLEEHDKKPEWQPFATGLRNPVGFDWHPQTKDLYASNNGPDHLGFEQPPEYFSRLAAGSFHGMPWFQFDGKRIQRDSCIASSPPRPLKEVVPPVATFPARNAPMAVAFVPENALDNIFFGDAVVALHGSWGTQPSGAYLGDLASRRDPKLVIVRFSNGEAVRVDDLISGFQLKNGERWARPVGVAFGPEGALYFSSDAENNGLYRLRAVNNKNNAVD